MLNLNKVKGNASKLEALVDYPKHKQVTEENGDNDDQECCCNLEDQSDANGDSAMKPSIEDFINIIEDSQVLQDKNLSLQLLLLIHVFIRIKLDKDSENNCLSPI